MKRKKPSQHRWFLIAIFAVILLIAVAAFILQRTTNLGAMAGEAIRQRIIETKQLASSNEEIIISEAIQQGKESVLIKCPPLFPAEQHWNIEEGWEILPLAPVDTQCAKERIICYYSYGSDGYGKEERSEQIIYYKNFKGLVDCSPSKEGFLGCNCAIKK